MTQDTMFQNLYIVYFKPQSRIRKYNTHCKNETFRLKVKHQHHAHSFKVSETTAPAGSVRAEDPLLCGHRPCLLHHLGWVTLSVPGASPLRDSRRLLLSQSS